MAPTSFQAPIARLPVELLSYIFLLSAHTPDTDRSEAECLGEASKDISPCLTLSSTTPDILAAVNRRWRAVALGTPQLWTRICVTIGDVIYESDSPMFSTVSRYLTRSARCPLDICIDARDPDWDFTEADSFGVRISPYIDEVYDYTHPFRVEYMHHVLNILMPHVHRFRSLAILTDRWAPMKTAIDCLSMEIPAFVSAPHPLPSDLPLLESLVLMRCNEFVSHHNEFSPADTKDSRLPFSALLRPDTDTPVLPGLKRLLLSGVHTQWDSLPRLLASPGSNYAHTLENLELSYHSNEVRPTEHNLKALLERCTRLRELRVRVSGPQSPDTPMSRNTVQANDTVSLPYLETVFLGYDDPYTATNIVDIVDAPNVRFLTLEDCTSPGLEDRLESEPLLRACTLSSVRSGKVSLPQLESLSLHRVNASAEAFEAMYEAMPKLRALSVSQMFLLGGKALNSSVKLTFVPRPYPVDGVLVMESYPADGKLAIREGVVEEGRIVS